MGIVSVGGGDVGEMGTCMRNVVGGMLGDV